MTGGWATTTADGGAQIDDESVDADTTELHPTDHYLLAERRPGDPVFDAALLPTCPSCGRRFVPLADGDGIGREFTATDGAVTTSHGVVDGVPVCVGAPLPAAKPLPRRESRAARELKAKTRAEQVEAAAQLIYEAALANRENFKASVWRIAMDKAGVAPDIRRHAVVHAIRAGWIEAMNLLDGFEFGDEHALEQYDRRDTRWRSHVYQPLRRQRRRPTTNGPRR